MSKCKFKIGDKVKRTVSDNYYWDGRVVKVGDVGEVVGIYGDSITVKIGKTQYEYCRAEYFVPVNTNNTKIIVLTDGIKTTTATLYKDGKPVKTAEAKCSPEDTFDFMVGAKLACERLTKEETPKPKYYNGKVVCIKSPYEWFTVGKVYEVKDGVITRNDGRTYPMMGHEQYRDAEDVRHAGCSISNSAGRHNIENEFIPLVGD